MILFLFAVAVLIIATVLAAREAIRHAAPTPYCCDQCAEGKK